MSEIVVEFYCAEDPPRRWRFQSWRYEHPRVGDEIDVHTLTSSDGVSGPRENRHVTCVRRTIVLPQVYFTGTRFSGRALEFVLCVELSLLPAVSEAPVPSARARRPNVRR